LSKSATRSRALKPWAELPVSAQVKRVRGALATVLPKWGLGTARLRYVFHGENTTFRAFAGRRSFLVRAHRAGYNTPEQTQSEMAWIEAVHRDTGLAAEPFHTRDDELIARLDMAGVPVSHVTVLNWLEGSVVGAQFSLETASEMGELIARLHLQAAAWRPPNWFSRPVYGFGQEFSDSNFAWRGLPAKFRRLVEEFRHDAGQAFDTLVKRRETGLLHSDLHRRNMLRTGQGLRVIDFDDCGYRPWVQDIAVACAFWYEQPSRRLDALLEGYHRLRNLPSQHLDDLSLFVAARLAGVALWVVGRARENAQFRAREKAIVEDIFKRARTALKHRRGG
jgi:Ser/Thr protein kinase RdoA (MazF antagonist)